MDVIIHRSCFTYVCSQDNKEKSLSTTINRERQKKVFNDY